jgi:ring-1,2-phenylacetyl-CoA epoxidase subunit PaaD
VNAVTTGAIWEALAEVVDPEIPAVSITDMGMVEAVHVDGAAVRVTVLPTFSGCPALPMIKRDVITAIARVSGVKSVDVETTFSPPWSADRITTQGRAKLRAFGLAPPSGTGPVLITEIGLPAVAECPFCGSSQTHNESMFGPTPCRAVYYCDNCRNPFELFKPI